MRKRPVGDIMSEEFAKLLPSIPFLEIHDQKIIGTVPEIFQNLLIMPPVSLQIIGFVPHW